MLTHSLPPRTDPPPTGGQPVPWERIEALLHLVQKPGRYVGGEFNAVDTPWDAADLHVCLAFPDIYDIGMSNFAMMILYDLLNRHPGTSAHRTYLPAPDMIGQMRAAGVPLYALEDYRPVAAYDVLAISTAYEQLFVNALTLMDLAGIPVRAAGRDERHPLVIGGGHGTFNPEPIADFFDVFVIGEAEAVLLELVDIVRANRGRPREAQLEALLGIPGLYIPRFYEPSYTPAGMPRGGSTVGSARAQPRPQAHAPHPALDAGAPARAQHQHRSQSGACGDHARLHAWLPLLPGRRDHSPGA